MSLNKQGKKIQDQKTPGGGLGSLSTTLSTSPSKEKGTLANAIKPLRIEQPEQAKQQTMSNR
ncbi:MAG: hypothetical protein K8S27_01830 [Candidatus Omnitrophica bacterium]|nr:hypothetical protein [Candidatus Omnitrophota bacterium]